MPAALGGELFHLLEESGAMAEAHVQFYAACLVAALQYLHARGVAYLVPPQGREPPRPPCAPLL